MDSLPEHKPTNREKQSIALLTQLNRELFGDSVTVIDATHEKPRITDPTDNPETI